MPNATRLEKLSSSYLCRRLRQLRAEATVGPLPATKPPDRPQKPLSAYLYIPAFSDHAAHTMRAWIRGELLRYAKRSSAFTVFDRVRRAVLPASPRTVRRRAPAHGM